MAQTYPIPNIDINIGLGLPGAPPIQGSTPSGPGASNDPNAEAYLRMLLRDYGLESLVNWAMGALKRGISAEMIVQEMRKTPEFNARFPAIKMRQEAGLPPIGPAEYVEYERRVAQMMRDSGMPPSFYDNTDDFTALLMSDKSPAEIQSIIQDGYLRVKMAPPEVRDVFKEWFGPDGDGALAAFFLDPDRAKPALMRLADQAMVGGAARQAGFTIDQSLANRIAETGQTGQAVSGFQSLNQQSELFNETISETQDLTALGEGVNAAFGLDQGQSRKAIEKRIDERQAQFAGSLQAGALGEAQDYGRGR